MDPTNYWGLAAAAVQFVDFSTRLFSKSHELCDSPSGELREEWEARSVGQRVLDLNKQIKRSWSATASPSSSSPAPPPAASAAAAPLEREMKIMCDECDDVARELLAVLDRMQPPLGAKAGRWENFRHAFESMWSQGGIERLQRRLGSIREQLAMHILVSMRQQHARLGGELIDMRGELRGMSDESRENRKTILRHVNDSRKWQEHVIDAIRRDPGCSAAAPPPQASPRDFARTVLQQLHFPKISHREDRIPEAYAQTFSWIFRPPRDDQKPWTNFVDWLGNDSSIYWITGKAGAGKSTLMKLLLTDDRVESAVRSALDPAERLCVGHFYFWNSGEEMQTTQEGLTRTLLHQLIKRDNLAVGCFPDRWEYFRLFEAAVQEPADEVALEHALVRLVRVMSGVRFVFFVDDLDELDGDRGVLVDFVRRLADHANVKLCVSSRPWPVFEDAFACGPSLRLEDLTWPDFVHFVHSNFNGSKGYAELHAEDPERAEHLVNSIVEKASGIFLWVDLVVKSLLQGMAAGERLQDLQRRLEALPRGLEDLFRKMLDTIEPEQVECASQIFRCVRAHKTPPSLLCLAFADEYDPQSPRLPKSDFSPPRLEAKCLRMRRRLNSHCKGLLEADGDDSLHVSVEYLHRTVRDFVKRKDTWSRLAAWARPPFNAQVSLCRSYLLLAKVAKENKKLRENAVRRFVKLVFHVYDETGRMPIEIMQDMSEEVQDGLGFKNELEVPIVDHADGPFLSLAVVLHMVPYLEVRLAQVPPSRPSQYKHRLGELSLLQLAVRDGGKFLNLTSSRSISHAKEPSEEVIRLLLEHGANPNFFSSWGRRETAWQSVARMKKKWSPDILACFLEHGADPFVELDRLRRKPGYTRVLKLQRKLQRQCGWWSRFKVSLFGEPTKKNGNE